jgi:hypothetical protein
VKRPLLAVVLFTLLAGNTAYYVFFAGRLSQALDALAWYTLLVLLTVEALWRGCGLSSRLLRLMRALRIAVALLIAAGAVLYVRERAWLDVANIVLWLLVVLLLELEVRVPSPAARRRRLFSATARVLYGALGLLVLLWLARSLDGCMGCRGMAGRLRAARTAT